ncbi:MAG: ParB N-terminal domain-containing protein, partial [Planctomycetota bacterium]|nr:ParB N-terminal domain-containing protein [Planctomycetota bacterium]
DSHWDTAEKILIEAAKEVTDDIIQATGVQPYVRCDWYDYGVYLRLRYQTRVKDRVLIAYQIQKRIFERVQQAPNVDLAIPFIYSYRAGADRRGEESSRDLPREIEISAIEPLEIAVDRSDVEQVARSIASHGLLQPIVVTRTPLGRYEVVAGHLRLEACKSLGWKRIPAVVRAARRPTLPLASENSAGKSDADAKAEPPAKA